jgi:hypothetical protein
MATAFISLPAKIENMERTAKAERAGGWAVNYGRMLVCSEMAKTRAPVDLFEEFFHPERAAQRVTTTTSAPNESKKQDSFDAFFHPATPRDRRQTLRKNPAVFLVKDELA